MREIKFRAWNRTYNWMEDHFYIGAHDGTAYDKPSRTFDTPNIEIDEYPDYVLMQYTGLKDANGVEIYEGDIVEWNGAVCYIAWEESDASFMAVEQYESWAESGQEWSGDCKVIGNIYQNQELLK